MTRRSRRGIAAAKGRPSFAVLSPGAPRATPSQTEALKLGFKIGTYPTGMLSPAAAGMKAGLAALKAGEAESKSALSPADLRATHGLCRLRCRGQAVHREELTSTASTKVVHP